jgi:uncharacterized membrane protein YbaN (DUF454 family)
LKPLYAAAGGLFLVLGIAGIFLPLLPTTPFLLLASACFLRGSPAAHRWMHAHPRFGPYLTAYEEGRGIPLRAKVAALALMWLSIGLAIVHVAIPWAGLAMAAVAMGVTVYLLRLPTLEERR